MVEKLTIETNYTELDTQGIQEVPIVSSASPQPNSPATPQPTSNIVPTGGGSVMAGGTMTSPNFSKGNSGWQIDSNGNVEFNDGTFRGALEAESINIPDTTTANSFHTDADGNSWWGATTLGAAPASVTKAGAATFTSITISGYVVQTKGSFGGDGSDGALSISSGTTTIDCANAAALVKNYTSISITGTGKLAFSNPATTGTFIVLKSQGAVTLTSSTVPCIDASGMGGAGAATTAFNTDGASGTTGKLIIDGNNHHGTGGLKSAETGIMTGGTGGVIYTSKGFYAKTDSTILYSKALFLACGSGGGSGGGGQGTGRTGGAGGNGGGIIYIECGGALNFTGTISVAGKDGSAAPDDAGAGTGVCGGGGGGGSAGMALIIYNTLTANSGTINTAGGAGGKGGDTHGNAGGSPGGGGGAGAGSYGAAGGNGGTNLEENITNGTAGSNAGGVGAGGGGGAGAGNGGSADPNTGGAGGSAGASDGGLVVSNDFFV